MRVVCRDVIAALEAEQADLNAQLSDPEIFKDYEKASSLQARAKEIETLLLEKLERWEMLEGKQNGGRDFEGSGSLIGVEISSVVYTFGFCLKTRLSTQK